MLARKRASVSLPVSPAASSSDLAGSNTVPSNPPATLPSAAVTTAVTTAPTSTAPCCFTDPSSTVLVRYSVPLEKRSAFERWAQAIAQTAHTFPGHESSVVVRPRGREGTEYLIIYRFKHMEDLERWESSAAKAEALEALAALVGPDQAPPRELAVETGQTPFFGGELHEVRSTECTEPVTVIVRQQVGADQAAAFEAWQQRVSQATHRQPGHLNTSIIKPEPGELQATGSGRYITLFRFDCMANLEAWLESPQRKLMLREREQYILSDGSMDMATGWSTYFSSVGPGETPRRPPPKWKMFLVTLLGVYISVALFVLPGWGDVSASVFDPEKSKWHLLGKLIIDLVPSVFASFFVIVPLLIIPVQRWLSNPKRPPYPEHRPLLRFLYRRFF